MNLLKRLEKLEQNAQGFASSQRLVFSLLCTRADKDPQSRPVGVYPSEGMSQLEYIYEGDGPDDAVIEEIKANVVKKENLSPGCMFIVGVPDFVIPERPESSPHPRDSSPTGP